MRTVIIGGSGHVGTYLVPRLVSLGHDVVNVTRGRREPYRPDSRWEEVEQVVIDRDEAEAAGTFGRDIAALAPDAVIDMICFTPDSARQLVESLRGRVRHFLHCGTIWVHGHSVSVPTTEDEPRSPFGQYGIDKAAIEEYLLTVARRDGFPASLIHPGHIVGPGWHPLNPAGHFNLDAFRTIARGEPLTLPNLGLETVHHVHADDVASGFLGVLSNWSTSVGESFHVVSPQALTLRGYAESMYRWFGRTPDLRFLPWEQWRGTVSEADAASTWDHIAHSPCCSIGKARRLIGYAPRHSSLEAVREAVQWLIDRGDITT